NRQRRTLLASSSSLEAIDPSSIERLQREVEIVEELDVIAKPLLTPGVSVKVLKEKLLKTEEELSKGLAKSNLRSLPVNNQSFAWHKLASALSKLEAYEQLIQASEKACQSGME